MTQTQSIESSHSLLVGPKQTAWRQPARTNCSDSDDCSSLLTSASTTTNSIAKGSPSVGLRNE